MSTFSILSERENRARQDTDLRPRCLLLPQVPSRESALAVCGTTAEAGRKAAAQAGRLMRDVIRAKARVIGATGNPQSPLAEALLRQDADWRSIENESRPSIQRVFRRWIKQRLRDKSHPGRTHYLEADAADLQQDIRRLGPCGRTCSSS